MRDDFVSVNLSVTVSTVPDDLGPAIGATGLLVSTKILKALGYQHHHIVPRGIAKSHLAFEYAKLSPHSPRNLMFLPRERSLDPVRAIHNGRHRGTYGAEIKQRLDALVIEGQRAGWTTAQYRTELIKVLDSYRRQLRSGTLSLYD